VKVATVLGTRSEIIRAAPVCREVGQHNEVVLIHTGEERDPRMGEAVFRAFDLGRPDHELGLTTAEPTKRLASMIDELGGILRRESPNLVLVFGDSLTALAATLSAETERIPVGHVEAGLRSFDRSSPEETHRHLIDRVSRALFCPTSAAAENLHREGIVQGVSVVGDVLYDVALQYAQAARERDIVARLGVRPGEYVVATVHHGAAVDDPQALASIVGALVECGRSVVFPVHPRTRERLEGAGLWEPVKGRVMTTAPLDYLDFLGLLMRAAKVVTDSRGVQREAYYFGVPCVTVADSTEWIETVEDGWNAPVGTDKEDVLHAILHFNPSGTKTKSFGDGHAAERIARIIDGMT